MLVRVQPLEPFRPLANFVLRYFITLTKQEGVKIMRNRRTYVSFVIVLLFAVSFLVSGCGVVEDPVSPTDEPEAKLAPCFGDSDERSNPFFSGYKPEFCIKTTDVT